MRAPHLHADGCRCRRRCRRAASHGEAIGEPSCNWGVVYLDPPSTQNRVYVGPICGYLGGTGKVWGLGFYLDLGLDP